MDKTKKIYFLFSFVMIIACYALNKSYSMFVASEEKNVVDSVVPNLVSELSVSSITLSGNEEYLIKQTITNTSSVSINYALNTNGSNYTIKMTNDDGNKVLGSLETNQSDIVYLYVKNDSTESNTITFELNKNYTTLNNDLTSNIDSTNLYTPTIKPGFPYSNEPNTLKYHILNNYINSDLYTGTAPSQTNTTAVEAFNGKTENTIKLPLYSNQIITLPDPISKPGEGIPGATEKVLAQTADDYGTSYYFRGNIDNNFLNYGGMCWRIVRIQGDGSIKLVLASEKVCSESNVTSSSGFATDGAAGVQGSKLQISYGYKKVSSYYINDYVSSVADIINTARAQLNQWLNRKITSTNEKALLKNDNWCVGDRSTAYDYSSNYVLNKTADTLIKAGTSFKYSAWSRINETKKPTLLCDGSNDRTGEIDTNNIGMLTADEVVFAGVGNNSYINKNASSQWWYVLSLGAFVKPYDYPFYVDNSDGNLYSYASHNVYGYYEALRPSITLLPNVQVVNGIGTIENPYTLKLN